MGMRALNNKILVVDDEKEIRELLEIYLKNEGYQVIKAASGEEALKILKLAPKRCRGSLFLR